MNLKEDVNSSFAFRHFKNSKPYNIRLPFRKQYEFKKMRFELAIKLLEMGFNNGGDDLFYVKWTDTEFLSVWLPSPKIIGYRCSDKSYALFFRDSSKLFQQIKKDIVTLALRGDENDG